MTSRKLLLALAALLVASLAAEGVMRAVLAARGQGYDASEAVERFEGALGALSGDMLPRPAADREDSALFLHPFYGWEARSYHLRLVDDVADFAAGLADDVFTIALIGGSVAGLFAEPDVGASDVLARDLAADPRFAGRTIRFLSHGRGAFKQPQQLFVLSWLFALGVEPDAVINLDGFNELAVSNQNTLYDAHPLFPSFPQWGPRIRANLLSEPELFDAVVAARTSVRSIAENALSRGYARSAIIGRFALGRLEAAERRSQSAQQALLLSLRKGEGGKNYLGPPFEGDVEDVLELAVRCWRETSRDLEAICRRRGILYLHALQPTLHDRGSKPLTAEEVEKGEAVQEWIDAIQRGYPRLRAEGAALAAEGFPFYDASLVFADVEESLYYDPCHVEREGNEILAHALAAAFLEILPPE